MSYQKRIIEETKAAFVEAFRYAKAVPQDKLAWKPMDAGRNVLDLCQEMAMCPGWAVDLIEGKEDADYEAEMQAMESKLSTLEGCETVCNERMSAFEACANGMSDDQLSNTKWLPYDGGRDFTFAEILAYPRWNMNYHLGQIAYIQTLLGDKESH